MQISSPAAGLRAVPEDGVLVLPGVFGGVPGLHRPLPLLQIPPGLRHLGTVPPRGQEAVQGAGTH